MPRSKRLALGLMSGTSADGLSAALVELGGARPRVLAHHTYGYRPDFQKRLLEGPSLSVAEISRLDFDLGRLYARLAERFLKRARISAKRLSVIGSHGQTIIHQPGRATFQIGEPSFLAERLGVPVVADFRPRDMAAGGEGAPIVSFLDQAVFGKASPRLLLNLGGIANVSLVGRGIKTVAFDTGPANALIDAAVRRMTKGRKAFDREGRIARSGCVDERMVERLLRFPYFRRKPPKSLDRATFSENYLERWFPARRWRHEDAIATLTYLTAASIADAAAHFLPKRPKDVVAGGGGAFNLTLMDHLRMLLRIPVRSIGDFGIPPLAKEATAMAMMADNALRGRANHAPSATGARGLRVLGKILR